MEGVEGLLQIPNEEMVTQKTNSLSFCTEFIFWEPIKKYSRLKMFST
jgi:hypothetical protein